ncbi:SMP-30/gluconolactonase/LRE family protein [Hoeflea alexandrii]|uniref:SMP-30/gluconolactonase/LRE family protein n=1 Tax=Hoeflea alexandrii TaxID=288436 RepID=UPI0022B0265D|nr:SMP-30/gluconolactonase/LRE family protein [Hoeflea alexandrii]MCZ4290668.1 SMP-30/gluconolactonase/LRE family protein [Hoeflea alexandrii]
MTHSTSQLYQVNDDRFSNLIHSNARLESLWTGGRWTEGPVYFAAGRYLLWSDIPNDRVMRWDETDGSVSVFEQPCRHQNGHTTDPQGRLISCEHGGRAVSRIEHDGSRTVLADRFDGRKLNSPNDVVVKSDGSIWFSDPTYGIDSDYEGHAAPSEIGASQVYRIAPDGTVSGVVSDLVQPNGLAFSPDEAFLYVADTGRTHVADCAPKIRRYPVATGGASLGAGTNFVLSDSGLFDGFRVDVSGNIWSSAGDGVHCYSPDGDLLGKILVPEVVSNVCFFGANRNRLAICATTSVYSIYVRTRGC